MNMRNYARALVALAAAYAVALQMLLLAIGGPAAGATEFAALPICASLGAGHSAPADHGRDCLGTCLACCCGGAPVAPAPAMGVRYVPVPGQFVAGIAEAIAPSPFSVTAANRSRAPPVA